VVKQREPLCTKKGQSIVALKNRLLKFFQDVTFSTSIMPASKSFGEIPDDCIVSKKKKAL